MKITEELIEVACEAFYNDPSGLTVWARTTQVSPTMANRYRAAMARALEASLAEAWDSAYQVALEDEGMNRPTTPNPYRTTK